MGDLSSLLRAEFPLSIELLLLAFKGDCEDKAFPERFSSAHWKKLQPDPLEISNIKQISTNFNTINYKENIKNNTLAWSR